MKQKGITEQNIPQHCGSKAISSIEDLEDLCSGIALPLKESLRALKDAYPGCTPVITFNFSGNFTMTVKSEDNK